MNNVELTGLFLNIIIYIIMIFPILIIASNKKCFSSKKIFSKYLIISFIIEILFSLIFYSFPKNIFSFFSKTPGVINYATYASKKLFISSSLYGIKILIPTYLLKNNNNFSRKKTAIIFLSKIAVCLTFIFICYNLLNIEILLYLIPSIDLIYYAIYAFIFLKIV